MDVVERCSLEDNARTWREIIQMCRHREFCQSTRGSYALWFILVPALTVAVYTVVYSYVAYQNELKGT